MQYHWRLHPSKAGRGRDASSSHPAPADTSEVDRPQTSNNNEQQVVSNSNFSFNLGDDVYVRPKSAKELGISGKIVDICDATTSTDVVSEEAPPERSRSKRRRVEDVRVSIRPHCFDAEPAAEKDATGNDSETKRNVRPSRLFPIYDIRRNDRGGNPLVVVTPDTSNYRQLASSHLRPGDNVLEIGCSTGETTALLVRRLLLLRPRQGSHGQGRRGRVVAFDTGADMLEAARDRLRSEFYRVMPEGRDGKTSEDLHSDMVRYHKVDALADPSGARARTGEQRMEMVLVDIGGNRERRGVVGMLRWVQAAFRNDPPWVIIVKSEELAKELATSAVPKDSGTESKGRPSIAAEGVTRTGVNDDGFLSLLSSSENDSTTGAQGTNSAPLYSHPMKAPLVLSPMDNVTPICRFHNYHPEGCRRYRGGSRACPYDHRHCHWCRQAGHVARECDARDLWPCVPVRDSNHDTKGTSEGSDASDKEQQ